VPFALLIPTTPMGYKNTTNKTSVAGFTSKTETEKSQGIVNLVLS
jgi:hypothetical protein